MGDDPAPVYNWFGNLDYSWFDSSGSLLDVPYFETVPDELARLTQTASARQQLRLGFTPSDCTTVSGSRNCTEACSDPSSLFTPVNLRVCTALASAALLVQNETYSVDRSDTQTVYTIDSWQIPELSTFNATAVLGRVATCIPESCGVLSLGECTDEVRSLAGVEIKVDNLGVISSRLGHYCEGTNLEINADIAGPGVILSYFLETGLVLMLYLLLRVSTTWARRLDAWLHRPDEQHDSKSASRPTSFLGKLLDCRLSAAVTSSLVEFQEVQLYFIAAVEVATLVSYNPLITDTAGANSNSYAAMLLNSGMAALLDVTSIASIMLAQCCLQRSRMHWWYTFTLMTATFVLAVLIFGKRRTLMPPAYGLWEKFKHDSTLSQCGNNPSPMTYCKLPRETKYLDTSAAGHVNVGLGSLAWIGLLIDQLAFTIPTKHPILAARLRNLDRKDIFPRKSRLWKSISAVYWCAVEMLLFVMVGYNMSVLITIIDGADGVNISDLHNWSFGQLIAVTVWAPMIAKFIYYNVFGVREGFEPRIARSFHITRDGDAGEADDAPPKSGRSMPHAATYPFVGDEMHNSSHVRVS